MPVKFTRTCISLALAAPILLGCEGLTTRSDTVTIELDSFNLIGNNNAAGLRAVVTGNPACTASMTSVDSLLAQVDNYDDIVDYLDTLDINEVQYRISSNTTSVDAIASMSMTNPANGQMTPIASINVPANQLVSEWTELPFEDGGAVIAQHYMDNLSDSFLYCADGSPNSTQLSMTLELRLDLTVKIDLL